MLPGLFALTTFVSTMLGGLFALRYRRHLHRILGFTAGVLLGIIAFDLLPEIFELVEETGISPMVPMLALVVGFLGFHILEKLTLLHHAHAHEHELARDHKHPRIGQLSAFALATHSFLDGVGIGLAFQISPSVGLAVAIAVIAHDFSDGLNTVSLMLNHRNTPRRTIWLLLLVAIAPVIGAASTLLFSLSPTHLLIYLGLFAGFLLYIGASDILPEAHAKQSSRLTLMLTVLGTGFIWAVTTLLHSLHVH
jgi:zinc transporter ZupT